MLSIRVTADDGTSHVYPFRSGEVSIGRDADNDIVLQGTGVSGHHCVVRQQGETFTVRERGSTNGTFLNSRRIVEPTEMSTRDRLYIAGFLVELTREAAPQVEAVQAPAPELDRPSRLRGPIIRRPGPDREWRDQHARLLRYAAEWDEKSRPDRLMLDADELARAARWLARDRPDRNPPVTQLQRDFLAASVSGRRRRMIRTIVMLVVLAPLVLGTVGFGIWYAVTHSDTEPEPVGDTGTTGEVVAVADSTTPPDEGEAAAQVKKEWIEHEVVPAETIEDVAERYDVPIRNICRWNSLNPDAPEIEAGQKLKIKPNVDPVPLPQQRVIYEVERKDNWRKLSQRFGIPVKRLRSYNPKIGKKLKPRQELIVWFDPKPHGAREDPPPLPEFDIRPDAHSVGKPANGRLVNGLRCPESQLYTRRYPNIMYGASHTILHLQRAIAMFRRDNAFDGVVVVADISKRNGGHFPPHKSHQAGRDIDIWLPTLRGIYKKKYLTGGGEKLGRRPYPNEVDWFAAWGLIRALIATGEVKNIFLIHSLQEKVYKAAKIMGASDEELRKAMQWPRPRYASGILGHSDGHSRHIHVRFKCGPNDGECVK